MGKDIMNFLESIKFYLSIKGRRISLLREYGGIKFHKGIGF
jgi:hypothetical protein